MCPVQKSSIFPLVNDRNLPVQSEIGFGITGNIQGYGQFLDALMPGGHTVTAIGNVLDPVFPGFAGQCKIGRRDNDDVARHLRVHIA